MPDQNGPAMFVPDWVWAIVLGVVSLAWLVLMVVFPGGLPILVDRSVVSSSRVGVVFVLTAVQAIPIIWVSQRPIVTFLLVYGLFLVLVLVAGTRGPAMNATMLYAVLALCAYGPVAVFVWLLPVAVLVEAGLHWVMLVSQGTPAPLPELAIYVTELPLAYATAALAGLLFRVQRARARLEAERATAMAAAAESRAAHAIDAERAQMSGEVHDIAGHHLSSILLQTRAAADLLAADSEAHQLLDAAQNEAEATLNDLRQLVSALRRRTPTEPDAVPVPTLERLPSLIASVRALYPNVDVTADGQFANLDPVRSLACYRIIQESLTNARRHAPGAAVTVRVTRVGSTIHIEIINAPSDTPVETHPGSGLGIPGMNERAAMLGGTLDYGPTADGGWRVHAMIPIRAEY